MDESPATNRKGLLIKLLIVALGGVVILLVLLSRGLDLRAVASHVMDAIRVAGPWGFFAGMAVLPAVGFPMLPFVLAAGPAFGQQLGLGGLLACAAAAIFFNITLTYWLARAGFRPALEYLVKRLNYKIPEVRKSDQLEVTILVRVTPGPPFFVQSYLLGLAGIPYRIYVLPSFLAPMINTAGFVIFGDAIMKGKGQVALFGISLVIAAALGIHMVRRHLARKKAAAAAATEEALHGQPPGQTR